MKFLKISLVFSAFIALVPSVSNAASCAVSSPNGSSVTAEKAPKIITRCPVGIRRQVSPDEPFAHKRENPYSMDCDLGFNLPGFGINIGMGDINFCSIAQTIAGPAANKWNGAMSDVDKWTNWDVNGDITSGCATVNGVTTCHNSGGTSGLANGAANSIDNKLNNTGGSSSSGSSVNQQIINSTQDPTFKFENGLPIYSPPYSNL